MNKGDHYDLVLEWKHPFRRQSVPLEGFDTIISMKREAALYFTMDGYSDGTRWTNPVRKESNRLHRVLIVRSRENHDGNVNFAAMTWRKTWKEKR